MISNDWNFNSSDGTLLLKQNYRILYMYVVTWQMYWFPGLPSNSYLLFSSWFVSYIFDNFRILVFRKLFMFRNIVMESIEISCQKSSFGLWEIYLVWIGKENDDLNNIFYTFESLSIWWVLMVHCLKMLWKKR